MVDSSALEQLFLNARSYNGWLDREIPSGLLEQVYDLAKMGPTSANCSPARFVFVTSEAQRNQLADCVLPSNADKIRQAPCTVIIGEDLEFMDRIPELFPHNPGAKDWFPKGSPIAEATAFRNATLQGAYLMMAARSLGLDCGPMSGFNPGAVDAKFFAGTPVRSNFLCSLGYGDPASIFARSPRLAFDQACRVL